MSHLFLALSTTFWDGIIYVAAIIGGLTTIRGTAWAVWRSVKYLHSQRRKTISQLRYAFRDIRIWARYRKSGLLLYDRWLKSGGKRRGPYCSSCMHGNFVARRLGNVVPTGKYHVEQVEPERYRCPKCENEFNVEGNNVRSRAQEEHMKRMMAEAEEASRLSMARLREFPWR